MHGVSRSSFSFRLLTEVCRCVSPRRDRVKVSHCLADCHRLRAFSTEAAREKKLLRNMCGKERKKDDIAICGVLTVQVCFAR